MIIQSTDRCEGQATVHFQTDDEAAGGTVSGQIRGPFCRHSRTLPANHVIRDGRAMMVDPCFWTPKLPFLYEVQLSYKSDTGPVHSEFTFGLRWCIADRTGLRVNGKGYVVRAIAAGAEPDLQAIRAAAASIIMPTYSEQICKEASELGVLVVCTAPLTSEQAQAIQRFPAVQFANDNLVRSSDILGLVEEPQPGSVCMTNESKLCKETDYSRSSPRFIVRQHGSGTISEFRSECDRLQRDVAPIGQFAGYLIDTQPS